MRVRHALKARRYRPVVQHVSSSGNAAFDQQVLKTLRGYRFKPGTKGPFRWYISFIQPAKILVVFAPE